MLFNYHTHSWYCDGSSPLEEYIIEAVKQNFLSLGFSGHAPLPFESDFAISEEQLPAYCEEVNHLKEKYRNQLPVFLSLEMDYIPKVSTDFSVFKKQYHLDYTLGSVHLVSNDTKEGLWFIDGSKIETYDNGLSNVFDGDIRAGVAAYYNQIMDMLATQKPDVVGHVDKIKMNNKNRFFSTQDEWYKALIQKTIAVIEQQHTIVEVNTRGIYKGRCEELFPSIDILESLCHRDIPVTISTDAHKPDEISMLFAETREVLQDIGFKKLAVFNNAWRLIDINN